MKEQPTAISLNPDPSCLTESLRGIGYTLHSAVADIVDNSISAGAQNIWISMKKATGTQLPQLVIRDDGCGMTRDELLEAMRLGTISPICRRRKLDLGRFGLGLKTASFSQCRRLTVISKKSGKLSCFSWDLDYLAERKRWEVIENSTVGLEDKISGQSGTCVIWEKIDRVPAMKSDAELIEWGTVREHVRNQLRLIFHRFLEDEVFTLWFNEKPLRPWDPFLTWAPESPKNFPETVWLSKDGVVKARLQCYVLPPDSSKVQKKILFGPEDDTNLQGFFIYRGKRLITAGGWLGLKDFQRSEDFRLARVRLDFENKGDSDWRIDIKKSIAHPPREMKNWLRQWAIQARTISADVLTHNEEGKREVSFVSGIWKRPKRGSVIMPDTSNPIFGTLYIAFQEGLLTLDTLNGYIELLALSHPMALKSKCSYIPTCDICKAAKIIFQLLKRDYGREKAENILYRTPPFSNWKSLINDISGDEN